MSILLDGTLGITSPAETVQGALTTTGNTILGNASTDTLNVGNGGLVKDASGNVGIGTASPESFGANTHSLTLDGTGSYNGVAWRSNGTVVALGYTNSTAGFILGTEGAIPLSLATNGTERMRIDSTGKVGIGTASPMYDLQVGSTSANLALGGALTTNATSRLKFLGSNTVTNWQISQNDSIVGAFEIIPSTAAGGSTFTTPAVVISSGGDVGINFNPTGNARFVIGYNGTAQPGIRTYDSYATAGTNNAWSIMRNSAQVGTVTTTLSTTAYNTSSDYRLKNTIAPMTDALAKVAQLKPVTYKWKADGSDGQGFIAHELQAVVPDCVTGEKDAVDAEGKPVHQGIDTSFLVATLTAAIQEQQSLIIQLQADVAALKSLSA